MKYHFLLCLVVLVSVTVMGHSNTRSITTWGPRFCKSLCKSRCSTSPGCVLEHHCRRIDAKSAQIHGDEEEHIFNITKINISCRRWEQGIQITTCSETYTVVHSDTRVPTCTKEGQESETVRDNHGINLHQACGEGKLGVVKYILSQRMEEINSRGKKGRTPVMEAALNNHINVFNYLVDRGCNMSMIDDNKNSVLHFACYDGNIKIVKRLVNKAKCNIESRELKGKTPLLCAAENGHRSVVDFLLSKHCNLSAVEYSGNTIIHVACRGGHVHMVKHILLLQVSDIESKGFNGRTPVMSAVEQGHMAVVIFLKSKHCNLKAVDKSNNTILHVACYGGHLDMVKYILSLQVVDIDSREGRGRTPVMCAAEKGHMSVVRFLTSKNCNMTTTDYEGYTILHVACSGGHVDMVKHILSLTLVNLEATNKRQWTPVMVAVKEGHLSVVELLVSKHCSLRKVDRNDNNVLHLACMGGHVPMVKYILSLKVADIESTGKEERTPVMYAVLEGHKSVVDFLISKHCNLKSTDANDSTILHIACKGGDVDMVKFIFSLNVTDVESENYFKRTPVMNAVENGHRLVVDFLVSKHCNLKAVDEDGKTMLHVACGGGHVDMVKHIISLNVSDIESKDFGSWTPVMSAVHWGSRSVVDFLVSKHCNMSVVDKKNLNILHVASRSGNVDMVKHILSLNVTDIDSEGTFKRTPLLEAVMRGHKSVVGLLVSKHCNVNAVDINGDTVLHYACRKYREDMIKYLFSLNVTGIENKNRNGRTPIMVAVETNRKRVVHFLEFKHCNMKAVDKMNDTILHIACASRNVKMVRHILSLNVIDVNGKGRYGRTPVMQAARHGHIPVINLLVSKHCNMEVVDEMNNTILHVACKSGSVYMVKHILSLNVIDIDSKGIYGRTPVMYAVKYGHKSLFDLLQSQHCNLKAVDDDGDTILHYAARSGNLAQYILSLHVIDIETKGYKGRTPVLAAVRYGHKSVVDLLVSQHCNLQAVDNDGNTIIHLACVYGRRKLIKPLRSLGVLTGLERNKQGQTPAQVKPKRGTKLPNECKIN